MCRQLRHGNLFGLGALGSRDSRKNMHSVQTLEKEPCAAMLPLHQDQQDKLIELSDSIFLESIFPESCGSPWSERE